MRWLMPAGATWRRTAAGRRSIRRSRSCGVGLRDYPEAINRARAVEWANLCDANGWTIGGAVYEAPGLSKWDNLKRICQAGGAKPVWTGGLLDFVLSAPRVALDTITADDLAEGRWWFRRCEAGATGSTPSSRGTA
jgi:hypothetical protein